MPGPARVRLDFPDIGVDIDCRCREAKMITHGDRIWTRSKRPDSSDRADVAPVPRL